MHNLIAVMIVLTVTAPPTINSLSRNFAVVGSPDDITITLTGTNFKANARVLWAGDAELQSDYVSATELTATIPVARLANVGTFMVTVTVPGGQGGTSNAMPFTVGYPLPSLTSMAPTSAPLSSAEIILTVNGSNFAPASAISWKGRARSTTFVSPTQLRTTIPTEDLAVCGPAAVSVRNPAPGGGTSGTRTFQVTQPVPAITTLDPAQAPWGGKEFTLTVNGTNFLASGSVVRWKDEARHTEFVNSRQLKATISAADLNTAGTANVTVETRADVCARTSAPVAFNVVLPTSSVATFSVLSLNSFYIGGSNNPERVWAGSDVPLFAAHAGLTPTEYRISSNSIFRYAQWRPYSAGITHKFSATTTGERTLYFQLRHVNGSTITTSDARSDAVVVRAPFSTDNINPTVAGRAMVKHRTVCEAGKLPTGYVIRAGAYLDAFGIICDGVRQPLIGSVGTGTQHEKSCPSGQIAGPIEVHDNRTGLENRYIESVILFCAISSRTSYDPLYAVPVAGIRQDIAPQLLEIVRCPDGAFTIGVDVYTERLITGHVGVSGLGMICAKRD